MRRLLGAILCNVVVPQALWSNRVRSRPILLCVIAIIVNIGVWLERCDRDHQPAPRLPALLVGQLLPTVWDWAAFIAP
jgi:molybdopterin-containing oxidoreductase family membrane subunit